MRSWTRHSVSLKKFPGGGYVKPPPDVASSAACGPYTSLDVWTSYEQRLLQIQIY